MYFLVAIYYGIYSLRRSFTSRQLSLIAIFEIFVSILFICASMEFLFSFIYFIFIKG